MSPVFESLMSGLPFLLMHSALTFIILAGGVALYVWITPYNEIALIKDGNTAAAITLGGTLVGLSVPLAISLATSVNAWDIVIWGVVTLILMLFAYRVVEFVIRDMARRVTANETGPAILLASLKLAIGIITAAAVAG